MALIHIRVSISLCMPAFRVSFACCVCVANLMPCPQGAFEMPCIDTVEDIDGFEIQVKNNKTGKEVQAANDYAKKVGQPLKFVACS